MVVECVPGEAAAAAVELLVSKGGVRSDMVRCKNSV